MRYSDTVDFATNATHHKYIASFYYCLATITTVGYGDVVPINFRTGGVERMFPVIALLPPSRASRPFLILIPSAALLCLLARCDLPPFPAFHRLPFPFLRAVERVLGLVMMVVGISFYSYVIGSMSYLTHLIDVDPAQERVDEVNLYLDQRSVPADCLSTARLVVVVLPTCARARARGCVSVCKPCLDLVVLR